MWITATFVTNPPHFLSEEGTREEEDPEEAGPAGAAIQLTPAYVLSNISYRLQSSLIIQSIQSQINDLEKE